MSISELEKGPKIKNEGATSICSIKQKNSTHASDMELVKKETVTPVSLTLVKSNAFVCIDMENAKEPHADINDQMETEEFVDLTAHVISQRSARRKFTIKGLYEHMLGYGKQAQLRREVRDQEQPPQPEQAVRIQYSPTQVQGPLQSRLEDSIQGPLQGPLPGPLQGLLQAPHPGPHQGPLKSPLHATPQGPIQDQGPGYPSDPQFTQAQGYFQQAQGYFQQGQGYPQQGQGYPQQGQGYPQQGQGYPQQRQGYPDRQEQVYYEGGGGAHTYPPPRGDPIEYDPHSRNGFVRLVMSIVLLMLLITAGFVTFALMNDTVRDWLRASRFWILIPVMVLCIGANCGIIFSPCGRVCPGSCICLTMVVLGMSLLASKITSHYRTPIILYAVVATTVVVLFCVMLAFSSFDFTSYFLYIIGISIAFSVIVLIIFIASWVTGVMLKPLHIVILIVGTIIQVVVLTMELQMVLGGGAIELGEQDYALAAFMIYSSIIDIFLKMVQLMGYASD